jgi:hypothetical protein
VVAKGNPNVKLLISFMIRDEQKVKSAFSIFNLERTSFELEYATVKPNRWDNYALWSNVDLPMIKRLKSGKKGGKY